MRYGDTGLKIPVAISLSGREIPLRKKLTFVGKQTIKTKKPSSFEPLDQIGPVIQTNIFPL